MRTLYLFAGLIAVGFAAQNSGGIRQMLAEKNLAQTSTQYVDTPPPDFSFTCTEDATGCSLNEDEF